MSAPELLHHLRGAGLVLTLTPDGALHVAPRSALTDAHRQAIREHRTELLALLAAEREAEAAARQCADCAHLTRRRTCLEPEAAGLIPAGQGFGIAWPAQAQAATCRAFTDKRGAGT